jgi:hypothetical protein
MRLERLTHRLADLVDLNGPHPLVVVPDIEPTDLEAREIAHQEPVDAHAVERADIAGDERAPLLVGEIEARQRLGRIGLHGGAEGVVAQHLAAQMIHCEDRHDHPRPSDRGLAFDEPAGRTRFQ